MGDLLVRDVPEEIVAKLKQRAQRHGRSLQQELLRILTESATSSLEAFVAEIREHQARYASRGLQLLDSVDIIREYREGGR